MESTAPTPEQGKAYQALAIEAALRIGLLAGLFAAWSLLVGFSDSLLKPILLGRGSTVPMMVIFIGAIGGFMLWGIVGLFTGAVVFVLGYTLIHSWLEPDQPDAVRSAPGAGALPGQAERHHDNNA